MIEFIPIDRIFFMLFSDDSINFSASFPVLFYVFPSACKKICCFFSSGSSVFRDLFRSVGLIFMFFPDRGKKFFCPFSSFSHFFRDFPAEKSSFSGMNFPSERTFFPFLGEYFRIFFVSSDKEFHPSGNLFRSIRQEFSPFRLFFARSRRAHLHARNNILSTCLSILFLLSENLP